VQFLRFGYLVNIAAGAALLLLLLISTCVPLSQNDLWLQLKVGEIIARTGSIPHTLLFPFTAAQDFAFHSHEWGASLLFHGLDAVLGADHLYLFQGLMGPVLWALSTWLAWTLSRSLQVAMGLGGLAMVLENYRHFLRPEMLGVVMLLLLLQVLARHEQQAGPRTLWWVVPLEWLWANLHGSFVLGPVLMGIFALGGAAEVTRRQSALPAAERQHAALQAAKPYALTALAMWGASLITPYGWSGWTLPFNLSASHAARDFVLEWVPTFSPVFFHEPWFAAFLCSVLGGLALLAWQSKRVTVTDFFLFAFFLLLAIWRMRNVVWFGFVLLYVCGRVLGPLSLSDRVQRSLSVGLLGLALVGSVAVWHAGNMYHATRSSAPGFSFPQAMVDVLNQPQFAGPVLNSYELGSELVYRYYPRMRPSIDSRIDSYGDNYCLAHKAMFAQETVLRDFLKRYDVRAMVLIRSDFYAVSQFAFVREAWRVRYFDDVRAVLERVQ
jgi:hypothetical protein